MTVTIGRRTLPPLPHPDHLRKQAKARLVAMRATAPATRLAEAQSLLAQEYGFPNWAALQAEVARRVRGPRGQRTKVANAHVAPLYPERFRQDGLIDHDADIETHFAFFRAGIIAQIGFLFAALIGLGLVFVAPGQAHPLHVLGSRFLRLLADLI